MCLKQEIQILNLPELIFGSAFALHVHLALYAATFLHPHPQPHHPLSLTHSQTHTHTDTQIRIKNWKTLITLRNPAVCASFRHQKDDKLHGTEKCFIADGRSAGKDVSTY